MPRGKLTERLTTPWSRFWPMGTLCLLGGSRWLLEGARPAAQSTYATQSLGFLSAAAILGIGELWAKRNLKERGSGTFLLWLQQRPRRVAGGVCALAGTGVASTITARTIRADDATLALALTSCVVAVGAAAMDSTAAPDMTARLWPGLAAIAGLLLLLPQPRVQDWRLGLALLAMPLLTGLGAAFFSEVKVSPNSAAEPSRLGSAAWPSLLGAAAVYGILAWVSGRHESAFSSASTLTKEAVSLDGTIAFLTMLSLLRLGAMRWSAQFILVPLVALLEGVVFLRPQLDSRSWLAFVLLLISGAYLFLTGSGSSHV